MAVVSRVSNVVSKHKELEWDHVAGRRRIGSFFESIGKYAVDFSVNLTTKGRKGYFDIYFMILFFFLLSNIFAFCC